VTRAQRGRALGLLWLLVGAVPGLEAADAAARPGRFKLGPLSLTPRFELRNAGVDTNVFHSPSDPTPDTSVVSRLALDGSLDVGRRLRLTGNGYADLNYFRREGSERSLDYGGEGMAELSLGRLALFAGGGGLQAKQRFSIELTQRVLRQERWATAGLELALTRRLSTRWRGSVRDHEFGSLLLGDEDIKQRLDRRAISGALEARYALTAKTTAVASAERIEDRFFRQSGDAPRQTLSYRYLAGFELGERALVKGRALAGLRRLPGGFGGEGAPGYTGPALALATGMRLGRFVRLDQLADRDVYYSAEGVRVQDLRLRSAYVYSRYRAELALELPLDLEGSGFGEWQRARFLLPLRASDSFLRLDRVQTFGGSLLRRFGDGVKVGATLAWTRRLTNATGLAYEGLVYGLQAEIVP
jgi:hypothetical protein